MVLCADCGVDNLPQARFCRDCGRPLPMVQMCPSCGAENPAGSRFCNQCGAVLARPGSAGAYDSDGQPPGWPVPNGAADDSPLARDDDWQEAVRLMDGLAEGIPMPIAEAPPSTPVAARTPTDWIEMLGEPLVSAITLARCLSAEASALDLSGRPLALPALDSQAGGVLLGKQYGNPPPAFKIPKNRRPWQG